MRWRTRWRGPEQSSQLPGRADDSRVTVPRTCVRRWSQRWGCCGRSTRTWPPRAATARSSTRCSPLRTRARTTRRPTRSRGGGGEIRRDETSAHACACGDGPARAPRSRGAHARRVRFFSLARRVCSAEPRRRARGARGRGRAARAAGRVRASRTQPRARRTGDRVVEEEGERRGERGRAERGDEEPHRGRVCGVEGGRSHDAVLRRARGPTRSSLLSSSLTPPGGPHARSRRSRARRGGRAKERVTGKRVRATPHEAPAPPSLARTHPRVCSGAGGVDGGAVTETQTGKGGLRRVGRRGRASGARAREVISTDPFFSLLDDPKRPSWRTR